MGLLRPLLLIVRPWLRFLGVSEAILFNVGPSDTWAITGPIGGLVNPPGGMDVGFELAVIFAGIAYLILRRIELNTSPKERMGTTTEESVTATE